jgi:hypothetical protein
MTTFYSEPGVINAVDPLFPVGSSFTGLQANDMSAATTNTMCLRYLIGLAQASMAGCPMSPSFGTTILIPGHSEVVGRAGPGGTDEGSTYYFQKPYPDPETACIPITCNWPIRFLGTGSTVLSLLADEPDETSFSDFFQVSTSGPGTGDHTGGMTFEDLYFSYPHIDGESTSAAIHVTELGAENIRIVRCNFVDCPVGVQIEDGLQASILQCKFQYSHNKGTSIILGNNSPGGDLGGTAKQIYIAGSLFFADHDDHLVVNGIDADGAFITSPNSNPKAPKVVKRCHRFGNVSAP